MNGAVNVFSVDKEAADAIFQSILYGATVGWEEDQGEYKAFKIPGMVATLDNKLGNERSGEVLSHNSKEYLALISLFYNAPARVTKELVNAIKNDNRAEAWYRI